MKTFITITVLATTLFVTQIAQAQEASAYYLAAKAGYSLMEFDKARYYSAIGGDQTWRYGRSSDDNVSGAGIGLGYSFNSNLRAEIEYFYRTDFKYSTQTTDGIANANQKLKTQTLMAQVFYDFANNSPLTPYVFAGAGMAHHKTKANAELIVAPFYTYQGSSENTEFAWNVGLGTGYTVTDRISLDFMYRYISLGEAEWENNRTDGGDQGGSFADITANEFLLAVRYSF